MDKGDEAREDLRSWSLSNLNLSNNKSNLLSPQPNRKNGNKRDEQQQKQRNTVRHLTQTTGVYRERNRSRSGSRSRSQTPSRRSHTPVNGERVYMSAIGNGVASPVNIDEASFFVENKMGSRSSSSPLGLNNTQYKRPGAPQLSVSYDSTLFKEQQQEALTSMRLPAIRGKLVKSLDGGSRPRSERRLNPLPPSSQRVLNSHTQRAHELLHQSHPSSSRTRMFESLCSPTVSPTASPSVSPTVTISHCGDDDGNDNTEMVPPSFVNHSEEKTQSQTNALLTLHAHSSKSSSRPRSGYSPHPPERPKSGVQLSQAHRVRRMEGRNRSVSDAALIRWSRGRGHDPLVTNLSNSLNGRPLSRGNTPMKGRSRLEPLKRIETTATKPSQPHFPSSTPQLSPTPPITSSSKSFQRDSSAQYRRHRSVSPARIAEEANNRGVLTSTDIHHRPNTYKQQKESVNMRSIPMKFGEKTEEEYLMQYNQTQQYQETTELRHRTVDDATNSMNLSTLQFGSDFLPSHGFHRTEVLMSPQSQHRSRKRHGNGNPMQVKSFSSLLEKRMGMDPRKAVLMGDDSNFIEYVLAIGVQGSTAAQNHRRSDGNSARNVASRGNQRAQPPQCGHCKVVRFGGGFGRVGYANERQKCTNCNRHIDYDLSKKKNKRQVKWAKKYAKARRQSLKLGLITEQNASNNDSQLKELDAIVEEMLSDDDADGNNDDYDDDEDGYDDEDVEEDDAGWGMDTVHKTKDLLSNNIDGRDLSSATNDEGRSYSDLDFSSDTNDANDDVDAFVDKLVSDTPKNRQGSDFTDKFAHDGDANQTNYLRQLQDKSLFNDDDHNGNDSDGDSNNKNSDDADVGEEEEYDNFDEALAIFGGGKCGVCHKKRSQKCCCGCNGVVHCTRATRMSMSAQSIEIDLALGNDHQHDHGDGDEVDLIPRKAMSSSSTSSVLSLVNSENGNEEDSNKPKNLYDVAHLLQKGKMPEKTSLLDDVDVGKYYPTTASDDEFNDGESSDEEEGNDEAIDSSVCFEEKKKARRKLLPRIPTLSDAEVAKRPRKKLRDGNVLDDILNDDDFEAETASGRTDAVDYIAKYSAMDKATISYFREIFEKFDTDQDELLNTYQLTNALRVINHNGLSRAELWYIASLLDVIELKKCLDEGKDPNRLPRNSTKFSISDVDFRLFCVIATLSQRISKLTPDAKNHINLIHGKVSQQHLHMACQLFYVNDPEKTGFISLEILDIEMQAGNLHKRHRKRVMEQVRAEGIVELSFMDYLAYIPLFFDIHENIMDNPLESTKQRDFTTFNPAKAVGRVYESDEVKQFDKKETQKEKK
eukprot:m.148276 g.148276  ORF g.148276 m.148276 type:complete len:1319 (-) comp13251_c0_seq2:79-4035(-)